MQTKKSIYGILAVTMLTASVAGGCKKMREARMEENRRVGQGVIDFAERIGTAKCEPCPSLEIETTEAQVAVLSQARALLKNRKDLGVQRDAAVCFEARRLMDAELVDTMRWGGDSDKALKTWRAQAYGVNTFCLYVLAEILPK